MTSLAHHRWLALGLLAAWCGVLFFYGISGELYRTESLRAVIAQEALQSGNGIVPTLYGQPLLTKPPGMYIAIALVSWPLGEVTPWTARLPSAIAATITVFLFYWYVARHLGRLGGLVAAAILPVSLFWLDKAPSAEIDMVQLAWISAALLFFFRWLEEQESASSGFCLQPGADAPGSPGLCLLSLLCVAGGFLTKWTAPAFFYATVLPLLAWRRQLRLLLCRDHLIAVALAGLVCGGWVVAAAAQVGWETFSTAVSREALQHLSPAHREATVRQMGGHHQGLPYGAEAAFFPCKMLALALPWSLLALVTLRPGFVRQLDERGRFLWQALHCWAWPNLLVWTLLPDPSARHAAPLLPAFAGLAAMVICSPAAERPGLGAGYHRLLPGFLALWLGVKLAFVHGIVPARTAQRQPRAKGEQVAALVPAEQPLYLFRLKDEGIMFYTRHVGRRLDSPEQLPSSAEPMYCMLTESEWDHWPPSLPAETLLRFSDQQGAPILLVKVAK
jgi:4-amino-4-deoxy-L-arabinose transferase-like glycosyltransferase